MKTILITGIGGDIAQGVSTIVRETYPSCRIVGSDIHDRHGGALFADRMLRAPVVSDPLYDRWLVDVIGREEIDVCIPMSEAEIIHLANSRPSGLDGVRMVMANAQAIHIGSDKLRTSEFLGSIGVARPWTLPADALDAPTPLPCIFKARRGAGSKAVYVCQTPGDVQFYRERIPSAVLQELLLPADREVTCAVFRSRDGRTAVLQLLRTLVGGFTGWAEVIDDPDVTAQCTRVAEALALQGSINVQLRITKDGPRIFEINPRFSSTALIRHRMGFCDVVWSLQEGLGEQIRLYQPRVGMTAVRVQGAAVLEQ